MIDTKLDTVVTFVVVAEWHGNAINETVFASKDRRAGWDWSTDFRYAKVFYDEDKAVAAAKYITRREGGHSYSPVRNIRAVKLERVYKATTLWTKSPEVIEKLASIPTEGGAP